MQDTRGEALTYDPPGTTRNARDNAQVPRQRTEIEHKRAARDTQKPPKWLREPPKPKYAPKLSFLLKEIIELRHTVKMTKFEVPEDLQRPPDASETLMPPK